MRLARGIWLLSFLLFPAECYANWQYTQWGMTPSQVAAASAGTVTVGPGTPGQRMQGYEIGASGVYTSGNYRFVVIFHFKQNALALVHLDLQGDGDQCLNLKHDLDGVYGKPFNESNNAGLFSSTDWQDRKSNNSAGLVMIGAGATASCSISYTPLASESSKGL